MQIQPGLLLSGLLWMALPLANASVVDAIADTIRLQEHREKDDERKPVELLEFAFPDLNKGAAVADIVAGTGYYTALLSRMVGEEGLVYAINPVRIFKHFPQARFGFMNYLEEDNRSNVHYSEQLLDELVLSQPLDAAMMVLYYHDTLWTGVDRAAMNRQIYAALKPGARLLIVDHHAEDGAPSSVGQELHRMDASIVQPELQVAGFEFVGSSEIFENKNDSLTTSVFDERVRGKTHRFVYVFRKPLKATEQ